MSHTQREDWLLQTEPLHGARPRACPPVINDRSGGLDLEAAGCGGPEDGSKRNLGPSAVSRMTDLTGRGGDDTTEGGRPAPEPQDSPQRGGPPAPEPQGSPRGAPAMPRICQWSVHGMVVPTDGRMLKRR